MAQSSKRVNPTKSLPFRHISSDELEQTDEGTFRIKGEQVQKRFTQLPLKPGAKKNGAQPDERDPNSITDEEKIAIIDEVFAPKNPPPTICYVCGQEITKERIQFRFGKPLDVCMSCYKQLPGCRHCGFPTRQPITGMKAHYCTFCRKTGICSCCGEPITAGQAVRFEDTRGSYCLPCTEERHRCFGCGRLIPERDEIRLEDGRYYCLDCNDRIVLTEGEAYRVGRDLINFLKVRLGVIGELDLQFRIQPYISKTTLLSEESYTRLEHRESGGLLYVTFAVPAEKIMFAVSKYLGKRFIQKYTPSQQYMEERARAFSGYFAGSICKLNNYTDEYIRTLKNPDYYSDALKRLLQLEKHIGFRRILSQVKDNKLVWVKPTTYYS